MGGSLMLSGRRGHTRLAGVVATLAVLATLTVPAHASPSPQAGSEDFAKTQAWQPPASRSRNPTTWVVASARTRRPAEISAPFTAAGRATGGGPLVVGVGLSSSGGATDWSWVHVQRLGGGTPQVTLVVGPAEEQVRIDMLHTEAGDFFVDYRHAGSHATTFAVMVFVGNGVIDEVTWHPTTSAPATPLRRTLRRGTGTRVLTVGAAQDGVRVEGAAAGGGSLHFRHKSSRGLVGAFELVDCRACTGEWTAPGAQARRWVIAHAPVPCWCGPLAVYRNTAFAGPRGAWTWTWSGTTVAHPAGPIFYGSAYVLSQPVVLAYAPVGRDWELFRTASCGLLDPSCL